MVSNQVIKAIIGDVLNPSVDIANGAITFVASRCDMLELNPIIAFTLLAVAAQKNAEQHAADIPPQVRELLGDPDPGRVIEALQKHLHELEGGGFAKVRASDIL